MSAAIRNATGSRRQFLATLARCALRGGLGILFLATGIGKALDIPGFLAVMRTYQLGALDGVLWPLALAIAELEIALGMWILGGWRPRRAMAVAIGLSLVYFVVLASAWWRGLTLQNCGCFGVFLASPLRWYSPLEELAIIGFSLRLMALHAPPHGSPNKCRPKKGRSRM